MPAKRIQDLLGPALVAALVAGCETSEPGAGFTNGPPPAVAPEQPAVRTDLPPPDIVDPDLAAGKSPANSSGSEAPKPSPDFSAPAPKSP
jgi:hypothetical protein